MTFRETPENPAISMLSALLLLPTTTVVATIAAAFSLPGVEDLPASIGAAVSTVIAVSESRNSNRSTLHTSSVALSSFVMGATLPGAIMLNFYAETAARWSWHIWAASGFIVGVCGWSLVGLLTKIVPDTILSWMAAKLGKFAAGGENHNHDQK